MNVDGELEDSVMFSSAEVAAACSLATEMLLVGAQVASRLLNGRVGSCVAYEGARDLVSSRVALALAGRCARGGRPFARC